MAMKHWKLVGGLLAFWLCVVLYMTNSVPLGVGEVSSARVERNLQKALDELERLSAENKEKTRQMQELIEQFKADQHSPNQASQDGAVKNLEYRLQRANTELSQISDQQNGMVLTFEHENARRKVENTARELWFFLNSQLKKLTDRLGDDVYQLEYLKSHLEGYRRTMLDDFAKLGSANKADEWRAMKSKELGDLVQRRLEYIQNPPNCAKAKKIVCNLHKGCGFGCQLHHVTYCLIAAYAMERTLILESKGWRYAPQGWETVFQPLSKKCRDKGDGVVSRWGSSMKEMEKQQIISLPIVDSLTPRPDFMPLAVPADLALELATFHGDPAVWWIGQIVQYLMRFNNRLKEDIEATQKRMGFKNVIVGVHVRRTDKINLEAAFHSIEEYMEHVEEYYDQLERSQPGITRRVYLATDDSGLLNEAKEKYPKYKFVSDNLISRSASLGTRYTDNSLKGVIKDIYFLSRCDYLVCTFSSQVCRVAYEIMQTLHGDASKNFYSLDDVFYYGGQNAHNMKVVEPHKAEEGVMELKIGDAVGIAGNHWDGFSKGKNTRTGKTDLYPSYKVEDTVVAVDMPTYPDVPRKATKS